MKTLLVGFGWWGRVLEISIRRDLSNGLSLAGVVSLDTAPPSVPDVPFFNDIAEALRVVRPEVVVLATPHGLHGEQIALAAKAGCHVFCEKPLALTADEARASVRICEEAGVVLGIGLQRRCWPSFLAMEKLVAKGALGKLHLFEGNYSNDTDVGAISGAWRDDPLQAPGAGLTGMAIHALDQMVALGGEVHSAEVTTGMGSVATVRFASGALASLNWMQGTPEFYRLAVFGDGGWAELTDPDEGRFKLTGHPVRPFVCEKYGDAVSDNLRRFSEACQSGGPWPVSGQHMIAMTRGLEELIRAFRQSSI